MTTAVEWLATQLYERMQMNGDGRLFDEILEQAKHIEKKQIMDAYSNNGWNDGDDRADAEQYYKETYGK